MAATIEQHSRAFHRRTPSHSSSKSSTLDTLSGRVEALETILRSYTSTSSRAIEALLLERAQVMDTKSRMSSKDLVQSVAGSNYPSNGMKGSASSMANKIRALPSSMPQSKVHVPRSQPLSDNHSHEHQYTILVGELDRAKRKCTETEAKIERLQHETAMLHAEKASSKRVLDVVQADNAELRLSISETETLTEELRGENAELLDMVEGQHALVAAQQARAAAAVRESQGLRDEIAILKRALADAEELAEALQERADELEVQVASLLEASQYERSMSYASVYNDEDVPSAEVSALPSARSITSVIGEGPRASSFTHSAGQPSFSGQCKCHLAPDTPPPCEQPPPAVSQHKQRHEGSGAAGQGGEHPNEQKELQQVSLAAGGKEERETGRQLSSRLKAGKKAKQKSQQDLMFQLLSQQQQVLLMLLKNDRAKKEAVELGGWKDSSLSWVWWGSLGGLAIAVIAVPFLMKSYQRG